jgi:TIR domain
MPPRFFTSYARFDNPKARMKKVVDLLRQEVAAVASIKENDLDKIGFFDVTNIENGADWEKVLGNALREIPVLVCMCSPQFFDSPYCAKEFAVFQKRMQDAGNAIDDQVIVIPVIWEVGAPRRELPAVLAKYYQRKDGLPEAYHTDGLSQLSRFPSHRNKFLKVIDRLARTIGNAQAASKLPKWPHVVKFTTLVSSFHNPAPEPYHLTLTVLHNDTTQWKPQVAGPNIGEIFDIVARNNTTASGVNWEEIPADLATFAADLDKAQQQRQASIIVVSRKAATEPAWKDLLDVVDNPKRTNCAVLLGLEEDDPDNPATEAALRAELEKLLPKTGSNKFHGSFPIGNNDKLKDAFIAMVGPLRKSVSEADQPLKVRSEELRNEALDTGFSPDVKPQVTGPGEKAS